MRRYGWAALIFAAALALASGTSGGASPATLTVTSSADAGPMTLRHAIESANSNRGADIINFDPAVFPREAPVTIFLTHALSGVDDTDGVTIDGTGAGVIIDGAAAGDVDGLVFDSPSQDSGPITLRDFTVQNFKRDGLVLFNDGDVESLNLNFVKALDNAGAGFNVLVDGELGSTFVTNSDFSRNGDDGLFIGPSSLTKGTFTSVVAIDNIGTGLEINAFAVSDLWVLSSQFLDNTQDGLDIDAAPLSDARVEFSQASGNGDDGISVFAPNIDGLDVSGNVAGENAGSGIAVASNNATDVTVTGNLAAVNGERGISVGGTALSGANLVADNDVSSNAGDGIYVANGERWTISQNSTTENGQLGIDLAKTGDTSPGVTLNDPGDADSGANTLLNYPGWLLAGGYEVANGIACGGCLIEVFRADGDPSGHGEGERFLGSTIADGDGNFSFAICSVDAGEFITATATDSAGNTSEFSSNYEALEDAPACLVNGDLDCDGDVDARDALIAFIHEADATQISREEGCPDLGADITQPAGQGPNSFGDANCTGHVGADDGFTILRFVAEILPESSPTDCALIGEPYPG